MIRRSLAVPLAALFAASALAARPARACTNILVSRGATADGSTLVTYAADSHDLYGELYYTAAARHPAGAAREVVEWDTGDRLGQIRQAEVTYNVVGNMNEHQVAIGETTFGGRDELVDPKGGIDYGSLMYVALERARTAREAIEVMTSLVAEYGYRSSGESFSISDPKEVWILEMIGKGPGRKGAVWVARRVPDGHVSAHANHARIRQFPRNDPKNTLYAKDVVSFAREKGWFTGKDEDFSFSDTYAPLTAGALRACEARVWSVFRRVAPSLNLSVEHVTGGPSAPRLPLWVKPDAKVSVRGAMELMRDHFEGTPLDLSQGVGAGPFALPYRWRPMTWKVDGAEYLHERAISTQQTGFSFVAQAREWLPGPIGGVLWFGLDDTYSTVYVPQYCGNRAVPRTFGVGSGNFQEFSWDSAFWVFNFVSNWAYGRYSDMIQDVQKVQRELESGFLSRQEDVEKAALALHKTSPGLARDYLTQYSVEQGDRTTARWRRLGETLIVKYLDGNVRDEHGKVKHPDYPEGWRRRIAQDRGEQIKVVRFPGEKEEEEPTSTPTSTAPDRTAAHPERSDPAAAAARSRGTTPTPSGSPEAARP
ncbi:dipeptidase [Anaeromyxobacter sp. Fw109-5]|uniref:dipeptidase n=1 Tax=Anaeromyxobacter sp. (strain Fw109-5) TaxID=404589 RepID=UPI0000ED7074|nr:C69 family dipeptidase [Anaeromyxobacter sp. Fw109-5]ABS27625.1 peptidase U34 dipeptidase [Anaeromyxobacter sp. Fw109-5]